MILITGGAGYIGSVTGELLRARGESVVILDNLDRGHRQTVPSDVPFYQGNIGDRELVSGIAREHDLEACIHFAALAYVGESVTDPARYYNNNVEQGIALLDVLIKAGVERLVFSSTCATYGEPQQVPISEDHPQNPTNPYGWTKLMMERIMESYDHAYGLRFVALRYFNAAGATEKFGEDHRIETHLIPNVLKVALGHLFDRAHLKNAGVVHQHVDPTPAPDDRRHGLLDRGGIRHVHRLKLPLCLGIGRRLDVPDGHPGAGRGEAAGRGAADAGRAPGDDDNPFRHRIWHVKTPTALRAESRAPAASPGPCRNSGSAGTAGPGSRASAPRGTRRRRSS